MRTRSSALAVVLSVSVAVGAELPYGHPDFVPTPERPVGWRGNGSGRFVGATPVTTWDLKSPSTGSGQAGSNVIWKTRMPFYSASGPIVVGDKVFTTAEPDLLICVDAGTGKELWRRHGAVFMEKLPESERERLYGYVEEIYEASEKWLREPVVYKGTQIADLGEIYSCVYIRSAGHEPNLTKLDEFQQAVEDLAAGRGVDLKRIREIFQEVGHVYNPKNRLKPLATPDKHALMSDSWCGTTAATPASDGTYVIQKLNNTRFGGNRWGYVVCYDLEGNRKWYAEIGPGGSWDYTYDSPLIAGGLVIAQDRVKADKGDDRQVLTAFDIATGRKVWSASASHDCQSPISLEVDGVPLVHLYSRFYLRDTGAEVLDMRPYIGGDVDTPCILGDLYFSKGREGKHIANRNQKGRSCAPAIVRLKWKEKGKTLEYEEVWLGDDVEDAIGWNRNSAVLLDGWVYKSVGKLTPEIFAWNTQGPKWTRGMPARYAPAKENILRDTSKGAPAYGEPSTDLMSAPLGGNYIFAAPTVFPFSQFVVLGKAPELKVVGWPAVESCLLGSPYFQGDRMYVRDYRNLYCFGDPAKPYHTPKGAK